MAASEPGEPVRKGIFFAIPATPGLWFGIAGFALTVVAAALPWYTIWARGPSPFNEFTTIIQFDGISGLYVHPFIQSAVGFSASSLVFPFILVYIFAALLKVRKLMRAPSHQVRASTLFRSSLVVLIPFLATIVALSLIPSFLPADQTEATSLAHDIAAHPFGGTSHFTVTREISPGIFATVDGDLKWAFGPALYGMLAASAVLNIGSALERRAQRKAAPDA